MKRQGFLFEKLIDRENLRLALINASKGKANYKIVQRIKANPEKYINILYDILSNETYTHAGYIVKYIHDKGKLREIKKTKFFPDRVIHHAVVQVLNPILLKHFICHTYQSIPGKGGHRATEYAYRCIRKDYVQYGLMMDITKFYPSVDNKLLMDKFKKIIKDKRFLRVISEIVFSTEGLPIGNYTSQPFGNFFLSDFDHLLKEKVAAKYYTRYADDILILGNSKEDLHRIKNIIIEVLGKLRLKVKGNYQVFNVNHRPPDYLGYVLTKNGKRVRKSVKRRFIRLMKRNTWNTKTIAALVSYLGWLNHANTRCLVAKYFTYEVKRAIREYGKMEIIPSVIYKEIRR